MNGVVLIVEAEAGTARRMASWLGQAEYEVMLCPGPGGPEFTCLGGRGGRCPLAAAADVVVLDLHLATDEVMAGTPGWQLLLYYLGLGRKVVALAGGDDPVRPFPDDEVAVVRRPAQKGSLVAAVNSLASGPRRSRGNHPAGRGRA